MFESAKESSVGINIIGYAQSIIGIAEDVRMAARSAQTGNIPYCVIDAPVPGPARLDHTLDDKIVSSPIHPVSIYCLPPTEMIRLGIEGGRSLLNAGCYNIGAWHWELPHWPSQLASVQDAVDEIWVFSDFVKNAFSNFNGTSVTRMPLAVEVPNSAKCNRALFGLPNKKFLFLAMFDGNSWLSRKNPLGAVRAFLAAFPNDRDVGLVIKAISANEESSAWKSLLAEISNDDRVFIINKSLSRIEVTSLMLSCDAYVSLHRSEGFGRIIAEAMLLGVPTVVTNFSGNVDFCTQDTSYLVDGELVALKPDEYIFAEGQHWCDPDIPTAIEQLVRVRNDPNGREAIAMNAKKNISENYSIEAVAHAYKSRLQQLKAENRI